MDAVTSGDHTEADIVKVLVQEAVLLLEWENLPCLAYTINLVVQDGLKEIELLRAKIRLIIEYFKGNPNVAHKFRDLQITNSPSANPLQLVNEGPFWNSTFAMFERICQVRNALVSTIAEFENNEITQITDAELELIRQAVEVLRPFNEISMELINEKNFSASKVIVLVGALETRICTCIHKWTGDVQKMALRMLKHIRDFYPLLEGQPGLAMPTFLDPRFKQNAFENVDRFEECRNRVQTAVEELMKHEKDDNRMEMSDAIPSSCSLWKDFDARTSEHISIQPPTSLGFFEVQRYIEEAQIPRTADALQYWRKSEPRYPRLAKLAKQHLALVATSVPIVRTTGGTANQRLSDWQTGLSVKNMESVMFLRENISLFDE